MATGDGMASVEVRLFGPCTVLVDGESLRLSGARQLGAIAQLALGAGRLLSVDAIIDGLWGESPPVSATNAVQVYMSHLRRALAGAGATDAVVNRQGGYVLAIATDAVDALRIERLAAEGRAALRAGAIERATRLLDQALLAASGEPLVGIAHLAFAEPARARLDEVRAGAIEDLFDARLAGGDHDALVADLEQAVAEAPFREHRWCQLMTTLYRCGRQADALQAFQRARHILVEQLGISPGPQLVALENAVLTHDPSLDQVARTPDRPAAGPTALPAMPHALIGRDDLLQSILALHDDPATSLVALLGPGGIGKTTVALAAAHEVAQRDSGVVAFVDLADVNAPEHILPLIASVIGADSDDEPLAGIVEAVGGRPAFIVADNVEQIAGAGPELSRLAQAISGTVVATSRVPLQVRSEHLVRVPPVSLIRQGDEPSAAMLLFAARAAASRHGFVLDATVSPTVAEICERLDGLPLALELAAARLRTLPLAALAERLSGQLDLLTDEGDDRPARQQSLRVVLATTWSLLPPAAAKLAARLSVCDAPWALELAELVTGNGADVIDAVSQLVDTSLLPPPDEAGTYRFLATVRTFAAEQLSDSERSQTWDAIATQLLAALESPNSSDTEPEPYLLAHVDGLLRWCVSAGHFDLAGAVVIGMQVLWTQSGALRQGFTWARTVAESTSASQRPTLCAVAGGFATNLQLDEAVGLLEAALEGELDDARRHRVFIHLAQWAVWRGDFDLANRHAAAALESARATGRNVLIARAYDIASWIASIHGDFELSMELVHRASAAAGDDASAFVRVQNLQSIVDALIALGRHDEALVAAERTYEETARLGAPGHSILPDALTYLGAALVGVGRPAEALGPLRESIRQGIAMERGLHVVETLVVLAAALAEVGAAADALEIWGATDAFHAANGTSGKGNSTWPVVRAAHAHVSSAATATDTARREIGAALGWRSLAERFVAEEAASA